MKRQHPIKSLLNFRTLTAEVVLSTSTHIFTEIYNNPNYTPPQAPAPPVDPATLKSANDSLAAAIGAHVGRSAVKTVAVMGDGSFGMCVGELETVGRKALRKANRKSA